MSSETARSPVAVALSGGVDSAAAAALLLSEGYEVHGLTMLLQREAPHCSRAVESARRVAAELGISHEVIDLSEDFERAVISPFITAYLEGRTPNPCVVCNREIKFGLLRSRAAELGFEALATGHYARIRPPSGGRPAGLMRAADAGKDQSYVLWTLKSSELSSLLFPLGGATKEDALRIASEAGVRAGLHESQDICFLGEENYATLIERRAPGACVPGPVLDESGRRIGTHRGVACYTIGQRRGLGIGGPEAMYVVEVRPERNELVVGSAEDLACLEFRVSDLSFVSGAEALEPVTCAVKTRYRGPSLPAVVHPQGGGRAVIRCKRAGPPAVPGQSAVFYDGEELLGGGVITAGQPAGCGRDGSGAAAAGVLTGPYREPGEG